MNQQLAFVTTCMNRLPHLQQTLPINLATVKATPDAVLVLLDYGSTDNAAQWVRENFQDEIEAGHLLFAQDRTVTHWRIGHAKNVANLLAPDHSWLISVDADTFLTSRYVARTVPTLTRDRTTCTRMRDAKDLSGRVGYSKSMWLKVGGYDEWMPAGWGHDDTDLQRRFETCGFRIEWFDVEDDTAIAHDDTLRIGFCQGPATILECIRANNDYMNRLRLRKVNIANLGVRWGKAAVNVNFSTTRTEICAFDGKITRS